MLGIRLLFALLVVGVLGTLTSAQAPAVLSVPAGLPAWAFNVPDAEQPRSFRPEGTVRVPDSARQYEASKIAGNSTPPDWFPDEHPPAPRSVKGDTGVTFACGSCHLMSGQGHSESADIAGMPAEYLIRQMKYYKSGARKDDARMGPIANTTSDADVREAAEYFAALKPRTFVKVIETATPPKTFIATAGRHRQLHPSGGTEPIGQRILQIPEDPMRTELRDPHSGFLAFVPPGSVKRGEVLVKTGGSGKTITCSICHGDALSGLGEVPRIAGQQPLYTARQLFYMQHGSSAGKAVALMKGVVGKLSERDIIDISAYLGSLPPL